MVFLLEDGLTPPTHTLVLVCFLSTSSVVCSSAIAVALEVTHVVVCKLVGLCMFFWMGQVFFKSGAKLNWVTCVLIPRPGPSFECPFLVYWDTGVYCYLGVYSWLLSPFLSRPVIEQMLSPGPVCLFVPQAHWNHPWWRLPEQS